MLPSRPPTKLPPPKIIPVACFTPRAFQRLEEYYGRDAIEIAKLLPKDQRRDLNQQSLSRRLGGKEL